MTTLISAKKCVWDVTEAYCKKKENTLRGQTKLEVIRKIEIVGPIERKTLTVDINGVIDTYTLGKKGEYYFNGQPLTKILETVRNAGTGNKIKIY